ncbi:MAG: hypothetical protein QM648_02655 [Solirubrobacterales bacterium]
MATTQLFWAAALAAGACVAGSLGPWVKTLANPEPMAGTDLDGRLTLLLGGAALLLSLLAVLGPLRERWVPLVTFGCGVAVLLVFAQHGRTIFALEDNTELVRADAKNLAWISAGWGLWAIGIGSAALASVSAMLLARQAPDHRPGVWPPSGSRSGLVYGTIAASIVGVVAVVGGVLPEGQLMIKPQPPVGQEVGPSVIPRPETSGRRRAASNPAEVVPVNQKLIFHGPDGFTVRVTDVATKSTLPPETDQGLPLKPDGKWIVVSLSVGGLKQNSTYSIDGSRFKLVSEDGMLYLPTAGFGETPVEAVTLGTDSVYEVAEGPKSGFVVFNVPAGMKFSAIQFELADFDNDDKHFKQVKLEGVSS